MNQKDIYKRLKTLRKECDKNIKKLEAGTSAFNEEDNGFSRMQDFIEDVQYFLDGDGDCSYMWQSIPGVADGYYANAIYDSLSQEKLILKNLVKAAHLFDQFVSLAIPMIESYRSNHVLWNANQAGLYLCLLYTSDAADD